ncbi:class I SAM-dependent methyltransferase [Ulvibacter antarcticus]|uniref:class I SAM-dependent methyltransferase n=1 Tax=Ulvibacter antarcticus TaxID=442714 RepID=UPI0014763E2A|nr:class I SAM-dependent methyltransferase [Ulvibacter antarcticus]
MSTKDFLVSGESFDLIYNPQKNLLCTSPQPKAENLARYYESDSYISHTDDTKGLMAWLYQKVKSYALESKMSLIESRNNGTTSVLDIGAGTGEFLKLASDRNWEIAGVEPNEKARMLANSKGMNLKSQIDDFKSSEFDVVTLWHVLEHLPDLETTIKKIEALVKPSGVLIIAVPNYKSYDANYYKEFWAAYDVPRHLWHFSKESMKGLFSSEMKLEKIKPMYFDSFYVSLLSEKYKTKNNFSIKALLVGLWSNVSGIRTKEYSSHIYCFRKAN